MSLTGKGKPHRRDRLTALARTTIMMSLGHELLTACHFGGSRQRLLPCRSNRGEMEPLLIGLGLIIFGNVKMQLGVVRKTSWFVEW